MSRSRSSGSRGTAMNCTTLVRSSRSRRLFKTIRLSGQLAARSCSTSPAVEPNRIAQTPIWLRATRTFPRAQSPIANSISSAAALLIDAISRATKSLTIRFIGLTPVVCSTDDTTNATSVAHSDFRLRIGDVGHFAQKIAGWIANAPSVPTALKAAGRLPRKQGLLALNTPRVARERPVVPHHPVTRNGDREVVRGAGAGNRTHCVGRTDASRDFRVGDGLTDRHPLERLPHPPLERGAADVKRQIET